jgi:hypothetical protein
MATASIPLMFGRKRFPEAIQAALLAILGHV